MYFNSLKTEYKSVFGAVADGERIVFRVSAPEFSAANMLVRRFDSDNYTIYGMRRINDDSFEYELSFEQTGVYFYHFELVRDNRALPLYRAADGCGVFNGSDDWQQTVFDRSFTVPDGFDGVIYQIFPDRFYKADIPNPMRFTERITAEWGDTPLYADGHVGAVINRDYFGGNLKGIEQKLPYLKSLGVTVIYLNPVFEAHSNHRYNTADYMKIDETLGTNEHFKQLCSAAKKVDIKIILDGVFSHTGADSIYFNREGRYAEQGAYRSQSSPYYHWYSFDNWPEKYAAWWGHSSLPEVNENDESFSEFITGEGGVIDYWMGCGASGFRLDVADELPDEFIKKVRTAVKRHDGILYGEVWEDASNKTSYGKMRGFLWGRELDSVMNYPFAAMITDFVKGGSGIDFINRVMRLCENYPPPSLNSAMNLLGTHDTERILTFLAGEPVNARSREWQSKMHMTQQQLIDGERLLMLASILQYTLPGVPSLYYADELLTQGYRDPFNRTCFDWSRTEDNTVLEWYRMLGSLRKHCPALASGGIIPVQYEQSYISFLRVKGDDELFVAVNASDADVEIWLLEGWKNDATLLGTPNKDGILTVPPKSAAVMGRGKWCEGFLKEYPAYGTGEK